MNPSGPGLFFLVGRLLIAASTSALIIGLFRDSTSSWFSFGTHVSVQEFINSFYIYWFMCIELILTISNDSLYFPEISGDIPL